MDTEGERKIRYFIGYKSGCRLLYKYDGEKYFVDAGKGRGFLFSGSGVPFPERYVRDLSTDGFWEEIPPHEAALII